MSPIGKLLPGGVAGIGFFLFCAKIYAIWAELRKTRKELRDTRARQCELEEELREKEKSEDGWRFLYFEERKYCVEQCRGLHDYFRRKLDEKQKRCKQLEDFIGLDEL